MRTELTDTTLTDFLIVCQGLPEDEIEQMEAFTGAAYDPQEIAVQTYTRDGLRWTCRDIESGEPLVVAGFFQVGVSTWRSFMLASKKAWTEEFAGEVTHWVKDVIERVARGQENIRLETVCLESRKLAQRWYKRVGLTYESTMQSYGAEGENAVMYVKTHAKVEDE